MVFAIFFFFFGGGGGVKKLNYGLFENNELTKDFFDKKKIIIPHLSVSCTLWETATQYNVSDTCFRFGKFHPHKHFYRSKIVTVF